MTAEQEVTQLYPLAQTMHLIGKRDIHTWAVWDGLHLLGSSQESISGAWADALRRIRGERMKADELIQQYQSGVITARELVEGVCVTSERGIPYFAHPDLWREGK